MIQKLGVQLYTIRDFMNTPEEIRNSFKKLKSLGYDQAQTAGCKIPYDEFGKIAQEEGIEIVGTHDDFQMMCNDFEQSLRNHQLLHTKNMGIGGFGVETVEKNIDFIEKANKVGEQAAKHGMKFTFHNHHREFIRFKENGKTTMDMLAEGLNPDTISFVLDTHWVQRGGGDVRHWIEKLSGRIDILHLKDFAITPDGPIYTEIGNGNLYWEGIFEQAEKSGVSYYVVEQDTCPGDPFDSLKISSDYIHKNFMG